MLSRRVAKIPEPVEVLLGLLGWIVIFIVACLITIYLGYLKHKCPSCKSRKLERPRPEKVTLIVDPTGETKGWILLRCRSCQTYVKQSLERSGGLDMAKDEEIPPDLH